MLLFTKQMNLLCRYGFKRKNALPYRPKSLQSAKSESHVCAVFIVSSNHNYSTLQTERKRTTSQALNLSIASQFVSSRYNLSTNSILRQVQGSQTLIDSAPYLIVTTGGDGTATGIGATSSEAVTNLSATSSSDIADVAMSSGTLTEDIATVLTDTLPLAESIEVPLSSLGLAGWSPVGMVEQFIELIHVNLGLPWWSSIILATFIARTLLFPVLVIAQRNAAHLSNYMPKLQVLQAKFNQARLGGNTMEAQRYGFEMQMFMKEHSINPFKSALIPLIQAPVFVSFFLGLRAMAKLPVESLKTGGIAWISDLTIPDPYYITPFITCATLYIVIKVGAESGIKLENMKLARYFLTALPIVIFPFTMNFPAAVLCYWCATNVFTLGAVSLLKIERVREALKIPPKATLNPDFVPEKKGFVKGIKDAYEDQKILNVVAERSRIDEMRFKKAGVGPIPRTYKYDPTKPRPVAAAAARKVQSKEYGKP